MQLHELRPTHLPKKKKRIGRGGKKGFYSGRGAKGQTARAGKKFQPLIRELIKRYPKLKGYRFKRIASFEAILNLEDLEKKFKSNEKVNPQSLIKQNLVFKIKGKIPRIKILGKGSLTKPLIVENCFVSQPAKEKIEKVGGKILQ